MNVADAVKEIGEVVTLDDGTRTVVTSVLRDLAATAHAAGVDEGVEDYECDHDDEVDHLDTNAATAALDRLHRALHDEMPVRACLNDDCRTIAAAIAYRGMVYAL